MPAKVSADKQAWLWAESTRPENVTEENVLSAYRLDQRRCKSGACRRNCRANPYCLTGLGEKIWLGEIDERQWHDIEDPNNERRTAGSFVGLKNLGATCYVNTFLQLWFHNPEVRRAMYMWHDPAEPADPSNNSVESKPEDWSPTTVCGQLQLTFALLEFSNRRYIDPTSFINCLGLNAAEQQDAQEFSKLFLSVLEDNLSEHADLRVQSLIQQQFCGGYAYLTRCSVCKSESRTPSKFFELDLNIKGNKTVEACIEEFLKVEKLDGDNQYMCETCNKKQNATREICLEKLPKVLNLQLLRFVFDRTTGHKKKLNSCIQFGEVLDVSKYIGKPEGTMVYQLTAVLIHRGPSAYSGHYVAHIKDTASKTWYKFNDEEIEKMEGRKLKLGTEDELPGADGDKQTKRPRMAKGAHSSKNAYMLVYTHWEEGPPNSEEPAAPRTMESLLSERVQACVRRDNQRLEDYILELITMREQNIQNGRVKQEVVRQIYTDLSVKEGGGFEWLSLDWISKWLTDPSTAPPLDHSSFLCPHGRLDPDKISKLKCVSELGAEQLFDRYSGGPRLKNSGSLCWKCVRLRCDSIQTRLAMEADSRFISVGLKADCDSEDSYWVGKSSLRSWRRLSTERLNAVSVRKKGENTATKPNADGCSPLPSNWDQADSPGEPGPSEQRTMDEDDSRVKGENPGKDNQTDESGDAKVKEDTMPDGATKFNEDILCELHGNLSPDPSCRRLVSAEVWERLRSHFPTCPEYRKSASICVQCQSLTQQEQAAKVLNKKLATEQKSAMLNVFFDRNRPSWQQKGVAKLFVVSAQSLEEWRNFIRDPLRKQALSSLSNDILVCPHAGLLYQPYSLTAPLDHRLYLLRPDEWSTLREHLSCDPEIKVCCTPNEDGSQTVTVTPAVCEDCRLMRMAQEEEDRYRYEDATIYVRKLVLDKCSAPVSNINNASKLIAEREDPEFICAPDGGLKRKKPLQENGDVPQKLPHLQESSTRKSNRHRRMRGEKEVTISSSQTLKELKVKIMKAFSVPPFDQTLSVDGRLLSDDTATVGGLRVPPGAIILLKADEPADDAMIIEDLYKVSGAPESGFKGTGLLSR